MPGTISSIRFTLARSGGGRGGRGLGAHHPHLRGRNPLSSSFSSSSPPRAYNAAATATIAVERSPLHLCTRALSSTGLLNTQVDQLDPQSRTAINTERYEYSQSGSDNAVAAQRSAWDPAHLTPEMVREASREEALRDGRGLASPLEVSPANQEVSMSTDEAGRGEWVEKGPSRRVSPPKGKKVDYGGGAVTTYGPWVG